MTQLIVFAGPNGSGKSNVRDAVANPAEVVIDPDQIAREVNPSNPRSADAKAARIAIRRFDEGLAAGKSISIETTLTGHSALQRMERAKVNGYQVSLVYVALRDAERNVRRVAARVRMGGHAIDPEVIRRRVSVSLDNLPRALAIADQSIVLDNSGPSHRRVLETAEGRVTFLADQLPEWLSQRMPAIGAELLHKVVAPDPTAHGDPARPGRSRVAPMLDALRTPEPTAAPWQPAAIPMAERIRAFEQQAAAERARNIASPKSEAAPDPESPKFSGPKP